MDATIQVIAQLGGTVFTVVAFLYYLDKNQTKQIDAQVALAIALENLTAVTTAHVNSENRNTTATDKNTNTMN